jgi:hypothetical protein
MRVFFVCVVVAALASKGSGFDAVTVMRERERK